MKKILVLVVKYPDNNGEVGLMYVHVRNMYYIQHNIDVTVLNFSANEDYKIDDIKVICLETYKKSNEMYDTLVLHAANLRNHYRFLKKYGDRFAHFIFFYHGHEVVKLNEVYPKPYSYTKGNNLLKKHLRNLYDNFKLAVWHRYLPMVAEKSDFVFVSNWLFNEFKRYVRLDENDLRNHTHIINNSVGSVFEKESYNPNTRKKFDFITIRSYMDDSKYCIDLVDELARKYSNYSFLIIGKGDYYKINSVPENVTWIDKYLSHEEIKKYIDMSKCGLLLTREDTQGVMTCELAVYGIPVITSDIEVCKEIFGELDNVELISNDLGNVNLDDVISDLSGIKAEKKITKFNYENTVLKEEKLLGGV